MGSFNINGFYSHLPIQCDDEVGVIICAQVDEPRVNLALEPTTSLYPIMAPVYGKYEDSKQIYELEDSYTAELFKQHTGVDVIEFIDKNHRNGDVSVSSIDNDNQFDDIPEYQKIIQHLVAKDYENIMGKWTDEEFAEKDSYAQEAYKEWEKIAEEQNKENRTVTYCPIFEHKRVLDSLINAGKRYHTYKSWDGEQVDISNDYDAVVGCIEKLKDINKDINLLSKHITRCDIDIKQEIETNITLLNMSRNHIPDYFQHNNNALCLYQLADNIDYVKLKNEFIDMINLDSGLNFMGGIYEVCRYGHQEYCGKDYMALHQVMTDILNEKHKKGIDTLLYEY